MKNTKNLERKSSADRITCFLPLYYNPLLLVNIFQVVLKYVVMFLLLYNNFTFIGMTFYGFGIKRQSRCHKRKDKITI